VAALPLPALRLAPEVVAGLARLGLRRVGEVLAQPRGPLARRFGPALVLALDEALGLAARPIRPVRPPPELVAARDLAEPILTREAIDAVLDRLLAALCRQLREAGRGVRRAALLAFRVDGAVQEVVVGTGAPTREVAHLRRLFAERLERLEPGFGFDRLALEAMATEPLGGVQSGLGAESRREALGPLLDRLSQRLAVWRLAPRPGHWPERAVARVDPWSVVEVPVGWAARPRPVRLLRRVVPVQAVALLPDAPPSLLRIGREAHRVLRAEGPERLAPEWWRDGERRLFRDYYRVELASGARLWVCRAGAAGPEATWVIHGHLA
jgi:protein ImuB